MDAISSYIDPAYSIGDIDFGLSTFQQEERNSDGRNGAQSSSFADSLADTLTLSPEAQLQALSLSSRDNAIHRHSESTAYATYEAEAQNYNANGQLTNKTPYIPSQEELRRFPQGNQADMSSVVATYAQNITPQDISARLQNRSFTPSVSSIQNISATSTSHSASSLLSANTIKPEQVTSAYKTQASMAARASALAPMTPWAKGIHIQV